MTPLLPSALLRAQTDERLVALAASGHDRAFEAIVERYRRPLLRYLRRMLSDTLAEDVVQATFINAWSSLHAGTEVRDLRPWLYRIAHNSAINALKKVGEAMEELPESVGGLHTEPEAELERRDEIRRALNSIAALPSRQRAALLAVAVDGRAHADVAAELGLTDGAVRQLVHRARNAVRTAATAITPMPLLHAVAASAGDSTLQRVAEVAAGAGGAGAASLSLKAGAAAVLATGALVSGAPQIAQVVSPPARTSPAVAEPQTPAALSPSPGAGASFASVATGGRSGGGASSGGAGIARRPAPGERRRRRGGDADRRGPPDRSGPRHGATPAAGHGGRPHPEPDGDEHADRGPGSDGGRDGADDGSGGISGRGKSVSGGGGRGGADVATHAVDVAPSDGGKGSGGVVTPPAPAGSPAADGGAGGSGSGSGASGGSTGGGPSPVATQVAPPAAMPAGPAPAAAATEGDGGGSGGSGDSGGGSGSGSSGG
jgi:RNA polymerase sigma factor (sigma-70 family)